MASYKFGQFRESQFKNYVTSLKYAFDKIETESSLSKGVTFTDKVINLSGENVLQGKTLQGKVRCYYLRFKVFKKSTKQIIDVKLKNTNLMQNNEQNISTIQIPIGEETDFSTFEIIITPNENRSFNQINFELARQLEDYESKNEEGTYGRICDIKIERLQEINNLIDILNPSIENKGVLKQIGIQSSPGLLMCINGEQIKVGRSGLYEIKNGIEVNFIGFTIENDERYFILDYQY